MNSKALTKIQSIFLITLVTVAVLGGGLVYVLLSENEHASNSIKIGLCADLDMPAGKAAWEGALLAAEEINDNGGILGKQIEIIAEDNDEQTPPADIIDVSNALTKLITVNNVDFLMGAVGSGEAAYVMQDIASNHKKIFFGLRIGEDLLTQRVIDDYEKYKYFFKIYSPNSTVNTLGSIDFALTIREYTGFNKVGILCEDIEGFRTVASNLETSLPENDFEIVYIDYFVPRTFDFTSYFAAIEAAGTEFLIPIIGTDSGIAFVKEWYDRQSPCINAGINSYAKNDDFWDSTDGKCEHTIANALPTTAGYSLTTKTLPFREAYIQKYGEIPISAAATAYDTIRFILLDALKSAGTTQTELVIEELEQTSVETTIARVFEFTSSHDIMIDRIVGSTEVEHMIVIMYQWQANRTLVPIYPKSLMEEVEASYTFPPWAGPWDNIS